MANIPYYVEMAKKIRLQTSLKIWNYLKYRILPRKAVTSVRRYSPQIGSLLLTMRCNLNCGYCNAEKMLQEGREEWLKKEATLKKVKRIFANPLFANCIAVDLLGGEPLLVKDLEKIVAYLSKKGHMVNMSTNGLLLYKHIKGLKRAGISRINISIYEANRSVVKRDLAKINKVFPVHASIVLLRSGVEKQQDELMEMAHFIQDAGCLSLRFWMYRPMGVNPDPKEIIADNNPDYLKFRQRMEDELPGFCVWPAAVQTEDFKKRCPQLWQRINADLSGKVNICCGTDIMLRGKNSNLLKDDPDAVYNHPTMVGMRKNLLNPKIDPPEICKKCNLLGDPGW